MVFDKFNIKSRYRKNPLLSQFSSSLPSEIKDMFKWMEFIVFNAPVASAGLKKLSETPITTFRYIDNGDTNESTTTHSSSWKTIIEKKMKLKSKMLNISYNTLLYGNQFVSVYTPFTRMIKCKGCGNIIRIEESTKLKLSLSKDGKEGYNKIKSVTDSKDLSSMYKNNTSKKNDFVITAMCTKEKKVTIQEFVDTPIVDASKINVIQWNPYNIEISTNKISGKDIFYYKPEESIIAGIKEGDPEIINSLPVGMIEAVLKNRVFKFSEGHLYHIKRDTLNGVSTAWGMPALASAIPAFLNTMILRRANEKIASDYLVPLRVMYPTQTQSADSVYNYISGSDFVGKINNLITSWKADPSAVQTAPFPVGVQSVLGDGKMLSVYQELEQAEVNIANSLGIPIEFIKGGLGYTGQGASLRLLENQMSKIVASIDGCIEFIIEKASIALKKNPITVEMIPFKIIDDLQEKATIVQLAAQDAGISKSTLMEIFNIDAKAEKEKTLVETKDKIKSEIEINKFQQDEVNSIEERARAQEAMSGGNFQSLNQQALIQEADIQVQQISQMQDGQKKSTMDEMSKTNYILYSVVRARLDSLSNKKQYQE